MATDTKYLTMEDVATQVGVTIRTVKRYMDERRISYLKVGHRTVRFTQEQIDDFMNRQEVKNG